MKRGTPEHPKIAELAGSIQSHLAERSRELPFELCQTIACGLFERLSHFAARYAPAGDIGKHSDPQIARSMGWPFEPSWIIGQMAVCRMIDTDVNGARLYVHDWHDHSDDAADKWLHDKGLLYANGREPRRGKKSRQVSTSRDLSSQSESSSESESKSNPESESVLAADPELRDWLIWWNTLKACGLVAAAVNAEEPSQGAIAGWKRWQKSKALRGLLSDRDAVRREIEASSICREGWFDFGKLMGGKTRDGASAAEKLLAGGYRDFKNRPTTRQGAGQTYDPAAAEKDTEHGKF